MSPVHLSNLGIPRSQPEDRKGLFKTRIPGSGHHGTHNTLQDTKGNHTHTTIHPAIQLEPQTRGLEGYGSSSTAPPSPQRFIPMEIGQHEVQPSITLGRTWSKFPEDMSQRDTPQRSYGNYQRIESQQAVQTPGGEGNQDKGKSSHYRRYRRTIEPDRTYSDSFRLTRSKPSILPSSFSPFRKQQIIDQESTFFTIPGSLQEKTGIQREKQDFFQPQAETVRPNDPEAVGIGERSKQEPEISVNTYRISSPINRNINPTKNEQNVVTVESSLNSDQLWLQLSQFSVQTQEKFDELHRSNVRLQELTILQEATMKSIQESCAKLNKASEETKNRLNQVSEEQ
ncbi:hypothetical protein O181_006375 [Austropuccinia psidii MF-1]|uniref:Uncharacterized protein n=1 Tax=Austropuccinia psidii MF-1 TaxID=1389203 RepID=A0A9Q3GGS7_9BASI|nr:hypothetical protein [Austropuccinia psidii MF-1]